MSGADELLCSVADHVATLTLNRPDRLNALSTAMVNALHERLAALQSDPTVRAVVITGAGRAFCAGGDIEEMKQLLDSGMEQEARRQRYLDVSARTVLQLSRLDKPLIAAVGGPAAGAGLSLALACDIRIASEQARFAFSFVQRGLIPDWGSTYFLPRKLGLGRALELALTGRLIDADAAERLGLVGAVVPHAELLDRAQALAREIAAAAPMAVQATKRALYQGEDSDLATMLQHEAQAQSACQISEDFREGVRAFLERRSPHFVGR